MNILGHEPVPGGYLVDVEVPNAYTDGSSRIDRVFVAKDEVQGRTRDEVIAAVKESSTNPFRGLRGADIDSGTETKAVIEQRTRAKYADWQIWRNTHAEAAIRSLPQVAVDALSAREDAAWDAYVDLLNQWRQAPS